MLIAALILVPVVTGLLARLVRSLRLAETINAIGSLTTLVLAASIFFQVLRHGAIDGPFGSLRVDALSGLLIITIAGVGTAAALASIRSMRLDLAARRVPDGRRGARWYYLGLHAFLASMFATVSVDNVGLLWVGIEATTLASALLVGFYRTRTALEAAWKYLILCTVGITFALFGVLLVYYATLQTGGTATLNWTALMDRTGLLDPGMMRLAFAFTVVGFGTKAGFAPLHTWLADAHSQAPAPISAALSGVLLSCAVYGILRFYAITAAVTGPTFPNRLLLGFGILSIAFAVPFLVVQRDLKRLLAYSSVEHIGLIAFAIGLGGPLGIAAGLLHLVNHAATKAFLFLTAGEVVQQAGTQRLGALRGVVQHAPRASWWLVAGILAITGMPPSGIFISKIAIFRAGFSGERLTSIISIVGLLLLGIAFAGLLAHALRLVERPRDAAVPKGAASEPTSVLPIVVALVPLAAVTLLFGLYVPGPLNDLLREVTTLLTPTQEALIP